MLFDPDSLNASYHDLLEAAEKVEVVASPEECKAVEENTREQASSPLWVQMREGRVTASRLVCCTDPCSSAFF
jgi:hypothetical protein